MDASLDATAAEFELAASLPLFLAAMDRLSLEARPEGCEIANNEWLQRAGLDFSPESLRRIDGYLLALHRQGPELSGRPLLSTIWATALYVGEVIRRAVPARRYRWASFPHPATDGVGAAAHAGDRGVPPALQSQDGAVILPSRAVLRVVLRGRKVRSIDSFARSAIHYA